MFVVRDNFGNLTVYRSKPIRIDKNNWGINRKDLDAHCDWRPLWHGFDDLTWESDPLEIPNDYFGFLMFPND